MSASLAPIVRLGVYPTPITRIDALSRAESTLWVKRDDQTEPHYGGNKVRKLERIFADARARGAKRLVTLGAVGSHHVLATAYFGKRAWFEVEAVLVPQPKSDHATENLRAGIAQGLHVIAASTWLAVPFLLLARRLAGSYYVPLGGTSLAGAMAYVDAAFELAEQVTAGVMPEPDAIVVAVGSGGTAAGLAAGLAIAGLKTRVIGIAIATPMAFVEWSTRRMARACLRREERGDLRVAMNDKLVIDRRWIGAGYGEPSEAGARAIEVGRSAGLMLDATYTAKAFAAALDVVAAGRDANVLFWNTLSSAPMRPLLEGAPDEASLAPAVARLLR